MNHSILETARCGDVAKLETLVQDADIETRDEDNNRPLHLAALNGHPHVVSFLLEHGANVHAVGQYGRTPIMFAAQCKTPNSKAIKLLYEKGATVNEQAHSIKSAHKTTAVHICCTYGTIDTLQALVEVGADLSSRKGDGDLPLHRAAWAGREDIVLWLLEQPSVDSNALGGLYRTSLMEAAYCQKNNSKVVCLLVKSGININTVSKYKDQTTALHLACKFGNEGTVN